MQKPLECSIEVKRKEKGRGGERMEEEKNRLFERLHCVLHAYIHF